MKLSWVVSLGMASLLMAAVTAKAQGPGAGPPPPPPESGPGFGMHRSPMERTLGLYGPQGRWWNDPEMVQKLQLTDDQRKAMDQILLDQRQKIIDMRAAVQKAELALEPMVDEDQPNESQILAQIDKVAQARAELEKANARFLLAIRAKLSPDQWKQLQAARAQRVQRRGWGPGGGMQHQSQPPAHVSPDGGPQGMLYEIPPPDRTGFAPGLGDR